MLALVMLGLLATLATLQYHWLGQISEAESERLKRTLKASSASFSQDFDREVTLAYSVFQLDHHVVGQPDLTPKLAERFSLWQSSAPNPRLVSEVYLATENDRGFQLARFNSSQSKLEPIEWTDELKKTKTSIENAFAQQQNRQDEKEKLPHASSAGFNVVEPDIPALVIPVIPEFPVVLETPVGREEIPLHIPTEYVIVKLNIDFIKNDFIPNLSKKYFSGTYGLDYNISVLNPDNQTLVYNSNTNEEKKLSGSDASISLFRIRMEEIPPIFLLSTKVERRRIGKTAIYESHVQRAHGVPKTDVIVNQSQSVTSETSGDNIKMRVVDKAVGGDVTFQTFVEEVPTGHWTLLVQHRTGSLETFVANARRQNLLISFGILLLLAASLSLIVIATRRSQLLAKRQLEFVSSVSHEFRTPLAVIRAAGENMADGIIESPVQVEKYGKLVLGEGRRLTEMVEQVLEFGGAQAKRKHLEFRPVAIKEVIDNAINACQPLLTEKHFTVETKINSDLPLIEAEANSLSRAIQNLINNAIKYDELERWISVKAYLAENQKRNEIVISVEDKGRGIAAEELKNIFEPFYRVRDVVDAQIHGNGLGLSLVKQTVKAHKGKVSVTSETGKGSTFFIHLPVSLTSNQLNENLSTLETEINGRTADGI